MPLRVRRLSLRGKESFFFPSEAKAWIVVLAFSCGAFFSGYLWKQNEAYARLDAHATQRLEVYLAHVRLELAKHRFVPDLFELDRAVLDLLQSGTSKSAHTEAANTNLARLAAKVGVQESFVLDSNGLVVAASNWYLAESRMDANYATSPIFLQAIQSGLSGHFAPNKHDQTPEYYFSQAIRRRGKVLGVAVAKISLAPLLATWVESNARSKREQVFVLDEQNQVVLTSQRAWLLRKATITLPGSAEIPHISSPDPIVFRHERSLPYGAFLVSLNDGSGPETQVIAYSKSMRDPQWKVIVLADVSEANADALIAGISGASAVCTAGALIMHWRRRRREVAHRLATRELLQRANDELGVRVEERTRELAAANSDLVREIGERQRAETTLRQTLDELVQAGKMAFLGQVTAGITHEINQPLTALRALTLNCRLLLERGDRDAAIVNLQSISDLTERMVKITSQLKTFGRKGPASREAVNLKRSVENSLLMLESRIASARIAISVLIDSELNVWGDPVRIEQVFANLLSNAVDALKSWEGDRKILIRAQTEGTRVSVGVVDTGAGVPPAVAERLFEPFFTTKPAGEGLGLGLVISSDITAECGGSLRNLQLESGAGFEVEFGLVEVADGVR